MEKTNLPMKKYFMPDIIYEMALSRVMVKKLHDIPCKNNTEGDNSNGN